MAAAGAAPSVEPTLAPPTERNRSRSPTPAAAHRSAPTTRRRQYPPNPEMSRSVTIAGNPLPGCRRRTGTIVIAVGETVFAGEAEAFMEEALSQCGHPSWSTSSASPARPTFLAGDTLS